MNDEILITDVPGFGAAGVHAGLKRDGRLDVALVVSDRPCVAAGTFTKNLVRAAPVLYDEAVLEANPEGIRGVVVNAKNANAVTGERGLQDAAEMARLAEQALGLPPGSILVMSTGVIGVPLPMDKIAHGVELAAGALGTRGDDAVRASQAIMTTDTSEKRAGRPVELPGAAARLAGMAKGSGMIHPNMATMLGLVVTDVSVGLAPLQQALRHAVERTFNCISVDGDTSTNDTLLVLASGSAGNRVIETTEHPGYVPFRDALLDVCTDLAQQIAFDGEGATKHVTIEVRGTRTFDEAREIGRTVATSPLVKTALFGRDANWGRVLAAAGRAGVDFDPAKANLWFGDLQLLRDGTPVGVEEERALAILSEPSVEIVLGLDEGEASATVWTCDLSFDYIKINAEYRT